MQNRSLSPVGTRDQQEHDDMLNLNPGLSPSGNISLTLPPGVQGAITHEPEHSLLESVIFVVFDERYLGKIRRSYAA